MRKKGEKMKKSEDHYNIRIIVCRSNPMILREICIPEDCTISEFADAAVISLGLVSAAGVVETDSGEKEEKEKLTQLFSETEHMVLKFYPGVNSREIHLKLYMDLIGKCASESGIPVVTEAEGYQLPKDIWSTFGINFIQQKLQETASVVYGDNLYEKRSLEYSEKKVLNALRKRFAPELAQKEVNTALGMPLRQLLSLNKLEVIKNIIYTYQVANYSAKRKDELIGCICHKYDQQYFHKLFSDMGLREYLAFREFVLDDQADRMDPALEQRLFNLFDRRLLGFDEKNGYCVASELINYYADLYDSGSEEKILQDKYLNVAMKVCAELYGIFDREMFRAVLSELKPSNITDEKATEYYQKIHDGFSTVPVSSLDDERCYHTKMGNKKAMVELQKQIYPERDFYIPDREQILDMDDHGLFIFMQKYDEMEKLIDQYQYYSYCYGEDAGDTIYTALRSLHRSRPVSEAAAGITGNMGMLRWKGQEEQDKVKDRLKKLLEQEKNNIPLMELRGYSLKNASKEMKEHYQRLREEEEAAAARNSVTAVRRLPRGKAVAVKKKGR